MSVSSAYLNGSAANPNRSGIGRITFVFDTVSTIDAMTSLVIKNRNTGNVVDISSGSWSGNGTATVIWVLENITFADAYYRATLPASAVTPNLPSDYVLTFHKLSGDVNGNETTNVSGNDEAEVLAHFNESGIKYCAGDADGDGVVSFNDYFFVRDMTGNSLSPLDVKRKRAYAIAKRMRGAL